VRRSIISLVAMGALIPLLVSGREREPHPGFGFCVGHAEQPSGDSWPEPILAGLGVSLGEPERRALEAAIDETNARWERRANPVVEDLEDGSPDEALTAWFAQAPEAAQVAMRAAKSSWCAVDGFCVRVIRGGTSCFEAERPPRDEAERERARFLAWPFGRARWFEAANAEDARALADQLRVAAGTKAAPSVGLVLHATDIERSQREPLSRLRDAWTRHETLRAAAMYDLGEPLKEPESQRLWRQEVNARWIVVLPRSPLAQGLEQQVLAQAPALHAIGPH